MNNHSKKKSLFEYVAPWALCLVAIIILVLVFNKDNSVKDYNEQEFFEILAKEECNQDVCKWVSSNNEFKVLNTHNLLSLANIMKKISSKLNYYFR